MVSHWKFHHIARFFGLLCNHPARLENFPPTFLHHIKPGSNLKFQGVIFKTYRREDRPPGESTATKALVILIMSRWHFFRKKFSIVKTLSHTKSSSHESESFRSSSSAIIGAWDARSMHLQKYLFCIFLISKFMFVTYLCNRIKLLYASTYRSLLFRMANFNKLFFTFLKMEINCHN